MARTAETAITLTLIITHKDGSTETIHVNKDFEFTVDAFGSDDHAMTTLRLRYYPALVKHEKGPPPEHKPSSTCLNCVYCHDKGQCRKSPPVGKFPSEFPTVKTSDWCGEFKLK